MRKQKPSSGPIDGGAPPKRASSSAPDTSDMLSRLTAAGEAVEGAIEADEAQADADTEGQSLADEIASLLRRCGC